ncbi:MAG: hypothetical protein DRP03_02710, partial [Candidatus Aenigmatarchaeota archaeon]
YRWINRAKHVGREYYGDKAKKSKEEQGSIEVEISILALRNTFGWGTARIQQALQFPKYIKDCMPFAASM